MPDDPTPTLLPDATDPRTRREPTGRRTPPTALMAVAAFCCLVVALQQTLVVPAIPHLPRLLDTSPTLVSWLVTATLLTGAVSTPLFGRLSDLVGTRPMLLVSMACVLVGSVLAPLGGIALVIAGRALQGVGTALVPVAMAQMRDSLPPQRVPGALALLSATLGIGGSIGIPLGGVMLSAWGWRSIFWLSAGLTVLALVGILALMPRSAPSGSGSFDRGGAVLLSGALLAILAAISQGGSWGWSSPATLVALVVGLVLLLWWGRVEIRHPSPLVDLRTSTRRPLLFTNLASLLLGIMMFTNLLLTTRRLQNPAAEGGFDWDAASAGLAMLPTAVVMVAVAPLSARIARRFGARRLLVLGSLIGTIGYLAAAFGATTAALAIGWTTVISAGVGIGYAALPMLIVEHAPPREIGSANGVNALLRAVGTAVGSSVVGTLTASVVVVHGGSSWPSAGALLAIAGFGIVVGALTVIVSTQARVARPRPGQELAHD